MAEPEKHRMGALEAIEAMRQLCAALAADGARLLSHFTSLRPVLRLASLGRATALLIKIILAGAVLACLLMTSAILWALYQVPFDGWSRTDAPSILVEAANGEPLGRVGPLGDAVRRQDIPDHVVNAVLSIEDRRFYTHWGVDLSGIARALRANWRAGTIVEGGSTISQQLAKMQLVGAERNLKRKLREALLALWFDFRLGKDEILTRYLNSVYLGAGAHGMSAAARIYFDKELSQLTLAESAMMAGLIQAPSRYDPVRNLEAAHRRAAIVVDAMLNTGAVDKKAAARAKAEPAKLKLSPKAVLSESWFADWIAKHELPRTAVPVKRAMRVHTTLQQQLQQLAEEIVTDVLAHSGAALGVSQAALVAMRPDGSVVAMVGGRDYHQSQFNRAVDARRQPGSLFKLFVFYAALRSGYSAHDTIDASPIEVGRWRPKNYGGRRFGRMTLSRAFAQSVNSAAIRLGVTVGLDKVVAAARDLGLDTPLSRVPSMALGTSEVSLLDLTGVFASVRSGRKLKPWGITSFGVEGAGLRSLGAPSLPAEALAHYAELTQLLRDVVERGTGRAAALEDGSVVGKTGTSQDYRDAWFIGFSNALVVGVWVGNDDRAPMKGVTGGSLPAEIWKRFVIAATSKLDQLPEAVAANVAETASQVTPQIQCDQRACAAVYASFRPSDCTYRSRRGARKLCERGTRRSATSDSADRAATNRSWDR
jgi:penicillin-binding protein 1A